ncbi:hypothetical protein HJC23_000722 [Cyclotella cryptica]|uniref:Uncharacterized protein n=1 Tax=Cyclotella cryptica TaxID=29204 RepID=A0ABD3QAH1_9STRA
MAVLTLIQMKSTYYRIVKKFYFDESSTVDFSDIFDGPAAIQAVPVRRLLADGVRGLGIHVGGKSSFDVEDGLREEGNAFVRGNRIPNGSINGIQRFQTV